MEARWHRYSRGAIVTVAGVIGAGVGLVAGIFGALLVGNVYYALVDPGPDNEGGLLLVLSFSAMLIGAALGGVFAGKAVRHLLDPSSDNRGCVAPLLVLFGIGGFALVVLLALATVVATGHEGDNEGPGQPQPSYVVAPCEIVSLLDVSRAAPGPGLYYEATCDLATPGVLRWAFVDYAEPTDSGAFRSQLERLANDRNYEPAELAIVDTRCNGWLVVGVTPQRWFQNVSHLADLEIDCTAL